MVDHPNRNRAHKVKLTLRPSDVRALDYVLSHVQSIAEDFPEFGAGNGYDAETVKDMHRGVELLKQIVGQTL